MTYACVGPAAAQTTRRARGGISPLRRARAIAWGRAWRRRHCPSHWPPCSPTSHSASPTRCHNLCLCALKRECS